jgi:hypothetical protein
MQIENAPQLPSLGPDPPAADTGPLPAGIHVHAGNVPLTYSPDTELEYEVPEVRQLFVCILGPILTKCSRLNPQVPTWTPFSRKLIKCWKLATLLFMRINIPDQSPRFV